MATSASNSTPMTMVITNDNVPSITTTLELDEDRMNELSLWWPSKGDRIEDHPTYELSPQANNTSQNDLNKLLAERELGSCYFAARLTQVDFGSYQISNGTQKPACRVLIELVFQSGELARLCSATVTVGIADAPIEMGSLAQPPELPWIPHFAPEISAGEPVTKNINVSYNFDFSLGLPFSQSKLGVGGSVSKEYSATRSSTLEGIGRGSRDKIDTVEWSIKENPIDKAGIPAKVKVALIVVHQHDRRFEFTFGLKATTLMGIPIKGIQQGKIYFNPMASSNDDAEHAHGSMTIGNTTLLAGSPENSENQAPSAGSSIPNVTFLASQLAEMTQIKVQE